MKNQATKTEVFRFLVEMHNEAEKYLDTVPRDLQQSVFDNEYVSCTSRSLDKLIEGYFGEFTEAVNWFLYEWKPGYEGGNGETTTAISNFDEYIEFMVKYEGWQD